MAFKWDEEKNQFINNSGADIPILPLGSAVAGYENQWQQPNTTMDQSGFGDWAKALGFGGNTNAGTSWKNDPESGLFGMGTASNWETGLGVVNSLGSLYGLKLQKDSLADTRKNNAFNASLGIANYGMKYDAFIPDFLQAQGKAKAVGDWITTQGGDAGKYNSMAGLALPTKANLSY
jgi:hypothetical protein